MKAVNASGQLLQTGGGGGGGGGATFLGGFSTLGNTAGNTAIVSGRLVLVGSDNITLSGSSNGGSLTISIIGASGGGGGLTNVNVSAGTTSQNLSNLVFSNSNNVSFGLNGSTVTASASSPVQSNQSGGIYGLGNTTGQSSSSTYDARSLSVQGDGIVSVGWSNSSLRISATQSNQAFSAGGGSSTFQTLSFSNANGLSFSNNAGQVQGSYTVPTVTNSSLTLSDNATSMTIGRLAFTNSNGLTLTLSTTTGGSATLIGSYTVPTLTNSSMTVSDAATSGTLARLAFTNLNGVTLSLSTGAGGSHTIVGSHNGITSQSNQNVTAANGGFAFQTLSFSNANAFSFGTSAGSAITGSYTVPVVPAQLSVGDTNVGNTLGDTGVVTGRLVLVGTNNITLSGSTNGGSMTISISGGAGAAGNTGFLSAGTATASLGTISIADSNGVSFGINGQTLTATVKTDYLTSQSNQNVTAANGGFAFQTLSFSNANNFSFGTSAGSAITGSYTVPTVTNSSLTLSDNATSMTIGRLAFTNSNGLTMTLSTTTGGSATLIGSYTVPTVTNSSWTVSDNATSGSVARLAFTNLNGVTLSLSTGAGGSHTIVGSHNGLTSQSNQNVTAANGGFAFQTLSFSNANNFSFGTSAGSAITGSYTVPTITSLTLSDNATSMTIGRLAFTNSNGLTLTLSTTTGGSATLIGSYTVPTVTNSSWTVSDNATSGTVARLAFTNLNGITLSLSTGAAGSHTIVGSHNALTSQSNQNVTAGNGGYAFQTLSFSNANNFSFGTSAGSAITGSFSQSSQSAIKGFGASNTGNTAGNTGLSTGIDWVIAGSQAVTISESTAAGGPNTLWINAPNAAAGNVTFSAGAASAGLASIVFSNSNGVSFGLNGSTITASAAGGGGGIGGGVSNLGNTAGSTGTVTTGNIVFVGSGVISLSQSTGAAGSAATISILAPATSSLVGVSGVSISTNGSTISFMPAQESFFAWPPHIINTQTWSVAQSTSTIFPIKIDDVVAFKFIRIIQSVSLSSMGATSTTANTTFSMRQDATFNFVLYTRGVGASSQSLQSVASTSASSRNDVSVQCNANGSQWTISNRYSFPASDSAQDTFSTNYATTSASLVFSTTHLTMFTGAKFMAFPWQTTLSDAQYWLAIGMTTGLSTNGQQSISRLSFAQSGWGLSQINTTWGEFGSSSHSSIQAHFGLGSYTTGGAAGTTNSLDISRVSSAASHVVPFVTFANIS